MDICKLSLKSGLTRENIRFYEAEGLLHPQRDPSGTLSYSDGELAELRKIRLLRQLSLAPDTIKQLQSGSRALSEVLNEHAERLDHVSSIPGAVPFVCRKMLEDAIEYADLDAQIYLDFIAAAPNQKTEFFSTEGDTLPNLRHPWRRLLARMLDLALYALLWTAIWNVLLHNHPRNTTLENIVESFISCGLMLLLEPMLLSRFGSTPGKWIFGLSITADDGRKLCYSEAFYRTWELFRCGMGYNIPFYTQIRMYGCYKICRDGQSLPWEYSCDYSIHDTKRRRSVAFAAAYLLIVMGMILLLFQAELPLHRGDISAAEFVENFNDYRDAYNLLDGQCLNAEGKWVDNPEETDMVFSYVTKPQFSITETNGVVTKVCLQVDTNESIMGYGYTSNMLCAALSFVGVQKEMNGIRLVSADLANKLTHDPLESFSFTEAGIRISSQVKSSGYLYSDPSIGAIIPDDSSKQHYHLVFTMAK